MRSTDSTPQIELIVRVTDGSFESRLSIPVNAPKGQHHAFAEMWIEALGRAVKITQASADHNSPEGGRR